MTAKANLALFDGQATPVSRTFTPMRSESDMESWSDKSSGIHIGQPVVSLSIRRPQKNAPSNRVRVMITMPTLEVSSPSTGTGYQPAPKVAYQHLATVDLVCPDRGNLAERKDILSFVRYALLSGVVSDAVLNAEMPY